MSRVRSNLGILIKRAFFLPRDRNRILHDLELRQAFPGPTDTSAAALGGSMEGVAAGWETSLRGVSLTCFTPSQVFHAEFLLHGIKVARYTPQPS